MSEYSTDSLEIANERLSRIPISLNGDTAIYNSYNLKAIRNLTEFPGSLPYYLKSTSASLARIQDTRSNETAPSTSTDRNTRTAGGRNAIIANGGFADASKRRSSASPWNGDRDNVHKRLTGGRNLKHVCGPRGDAKIVGGKAVPRCTEGSSKTLPSTPMKPDKKLGNVLAPRIQQPTKPRSYLELYRRRFSTPPVYRVKSPEGSTLSIYGDSQHERLTDDDDDGSLPVTPREDRSEYSFYRRIIEGSADVPPRTTRSSETAYQRPTNDLDVLPRLNRAKSNGDEAERRAGYRPYTIEEYRSLPIPKLDRSLGPDKVEMQAKREWLMRRRSYGNLVSARNRQQIVLQAQKLKTHENSTSFAIHDGRKTIRKNCAGRSGTTSKKSVDPSRLSSCRKDKKFEPTSSFCSSINTYDTVPDSYLESLRRRHLHEKERIDRILNEASRS